MICTAMSASPEFSRVPSELALQSTLTSRRLAEEWRISIGNSPNDGEVFQTPKSKESRLSAFPKSCPPAPQKLRPALRCKRRLSELEFFVIESDELERLFRLRRDDNMTIPTPPMPQQRKKAKLSLS